MKLLTAIMITLFSVNFINNQENNKGYDALWAEVLTMQDNNLPKSAYEIVEQIFAKAKTEKREDQLIKSIIFKAKLSAQFEDNDPADYIKLFEKEKEDIHSPAARAIYASLIGELYQHYGMRNIGRFSNRTDEFKTSDQAIENLSLEALQRRSIAYYIESLAYNGKEAFGDYEHLLSFDPEKTHLIKASNIREFILFRALAHFMNDQSFITQVHDGFNINQPDFLLPQSEFIEIQLEHNEHSDYRQIAIELFQRALKMSEGDKALNVVIDLKRLQYAYNQLQGSEKDSLYLNALDKLIEDNKDEPNSLYAYMKLIEYHLAYSEMYNNRFEEKYAHHTSEAYRAIQSAKKQFPDEKLINQIESQKSRLNKKYLSCEMEEVVPPNQEFLCFINYRNIQKIHFKLLRLEENDFDKFNKIKTKPERLNFLQSRALQKKWSHDLPGSKDFNYHGIEFPIEGLEFGQYVLLSSPNNSFKLSDQNPVGINFFTVSAMNYLHSVGDTKTDIIVTDRRSGTAMEGVIIEVYTQEYDYTTRRYNWDLISTLKSDENGFATYDGSNRNFSFKLINGKDVLDFGTRHYNRKDRPVRPSSQIHLFTDRAIYRPGQQIYFKGVVTETDNTQIPGILTNREVNIIFRDANWQTISETKLRSNDFGTFNGVLTAPTGVLTGSMTIECRVENGQSSKQIKVEEYKRPKIFAEIDSLTKAYKLGDSIRVTGQVHSFSGLNIEGAQIKYTVRKMAYHRYYSGYFRPPVDNTNEWVTSGRTLSNIEGQFEIVFKSNGNANELSTYNYQINVEVTDITGETIYESKSILLSQDPFRFTVELPQHAFKDALADIRFDVLNCDQKSIEASVGMEIFSLAHPTTAKRNKLWKHPDRFFLGQTAYNERFPYDYFLDEDDPGKWAVIKSLGKRKIKAGSNRIGGLDALEQGVYKLVFTVTDNQGYQKSFDRYISIAEQKSACLPTQHLWLTKPQKTYQPGDKVEFNYYTPYPESQVFYHSGKRYETLQSGWLDKKNNKLMIPITERDRGGFSIEFIMVKQGRVYQKSFDIKVPWNNKKLNVTYSSFRDKILPGAEEEWIIEVKDDSNNPVKAELLAAMYDASLDQFVEHKWEKSFYPEYTSYIHWNGNGFGKAKKYVYKISDGDNYYIRDLRFDPIFNWFGFHLPYAGRRRNGDIMMMEAVEMKSAGRMEGSMEAEADMALPRTEEPVLANTMEEETTVNRSSEPFNYRENLNETVFFFPELITEDGVAKIRFKMNEALTKWHFMLMAQTEDFAYTFDQQSVMTQKPLMVEPHLPRFVREGDSIVLNAKVSNLSDKAIEGEVDIFVGDYIKDSDLSGQFVQNDRIQNINLNIGESKIIEWQVHIPEDFKSVLEIKIKAKGGAFTDGEVNVIPVLSNRILVTESMPMHVESNVDKVFDFEALKKMDDSETLKNHLFSIEFTNNPSWLVLKAIPNLLDDTGQSSISLINSFYGTYLAHDMIKRNEAFQKAIKLWEKSDNWESQLRKNADLKLSQLEETPWVREAKAEEDQMRKLGVLLDDNYVEEKLRTLFEKLKQLQHSNGGFSWHPGGRDNWYITQYILESLGRLKDLTGNELGVDNAMLENAIKYIDARLLEYYNDNKNTLSNEDYIPPKIIHYMYTRSFFREHLIDNKVYPAFSYYLKKMGKHWIPLNSYQQALAGIALNKWNEITESEDIFKSLHERMIIDKEIGNYWNDQAGYYWYNPSIEKHSVMIEFYRLMQAEREDIDGLKLWLLKNKQTHQWATSKGTVSAIYAFMLDSEEWLTDDGYVQIILPKKGLNIRFENKEAKTGYSRADVPGDRVDLTLDQIQVKNPNNHVTWGAAHWQYFEDLNKIKKPGDNPLNINKEVFLVQYDENGEILKKISPDAQLKVGDKLRNRIEIWIDRPMEFVELKDLRSSGLEPITTLSGYQWQDGLGYYQASKDIATYFYFDYLPKGSYVFEYDLVASHKGVFSNGISRIECVYAPEFKSHSDGMALEIK